MSECHQDESESVELLPLQPNEPRESALTLQALMLLPFANNPTIPSPSTPAMLTVPYGSLINYAQHLIDEAGDPNIRFRLCFHHYFGTEGGPLLSQVLATGEALTEEQLAELKAQGKILDLNDPNAQQAIREGKFIIK